LPERIQSYLNETLTFAQLTSTFAVFELQIKLGNLSNTQIAQRVLVRMTAAAAAFTTPCWFR
jgi:hypothetical protein